MGRMKKVLVVMGVLASSFAGGMVGHVVLGPSTAQAKDAAMPNIVDAEAFRVVDADGNVRAALAMGDDGAVQLEMLDAKAQSRMVIGLDAKGISSIAMADGDGSIRWKGGLVPGEDGKMLAGALAVQVIDARTMRIGDGRGNHRGVFRATPSGPFLVLMDKEGKPVTVMGVQDRDGSAGFKVQDSTGQERLHLGIVKDGGVSLVIRDKTRKACTALGVSAAGDPELIVRDKAGNKRILLELDNDATGRLHFLDADGKPIAQAPPTPDKEDTATTEDD
ncbi:hypothetical protein LCGC14_0525310 [marine sediment metagenome]|uniref:Uncharacterized protein n=1 Tax=marine sediment metagenome TaxID=412755 RepID=A0A0F9SFM5_9ZZZZ|nr:hypothetical protein [Phycisphaerae bacterium]HDZ44755.1 hypothetical protein [Phycisphaerae bacterium]